MIRLAVRCRPELAERVLADLLELVPGGVEEVGFVPDPGGSGGAAEQPTGFYEYAIYGPPGEVPALPDLEAAVGEGLVEISSTEIPDDWADRWRDFHHPISIAGGRIVVRPSWEPGHRQSPSTPTGEAEEVAGIGVAGIDVVIDPGQAFGTGAHATTAMCLELLLELADRGDARGPLVDLGTGSGVLAIAAAKLGWSPVVGCDSEAASIEAATANAAANEVELELERVNLREQAPPGAPVVVANLTAPLLEAVLAAFEHPPATLICSGLLRSEAERVSAAVAAAGLAVADRRTTGDWAALRCAAV